MIACMASPALSKVKDNVIILGAVLSETGQYSTAGLHIKRGYELAIEKINTSGGLRIGRKKYEISLKILDDQSSSAIGLEKIRILIEKEKIDFLLGPFSTKITDIVAQEAERRALPLVSPFAASQKKYQEKNTYIFTLPTPSEDVFTSSLSLLQEYDKRIVRNKENLKIGLLTDLNPISPLISQSIEKKIAGKEIDFIQNTKLSFNPDDIKRNITKFLRANPDIIFISGNELIYHQFLKALKPYDQKPSMIVFSHCLDFDYEQYTKTPVLCTSQWDYGMVYSDEILGNAEDFKTSYREKYHDEPSSLSIQAAASIVVYSDAFKRSSSFTPSSVRDSLQQTNMQTILGNVKFNANGKNLAKPMIVKQYQNGTFISVGPAKWAIKDMVFPD